MTSSPSEHDHKRRQDHVRLDASLAYSDTAPRFVWRPQLEAWLKKHASSQLRDVQRAPSPEPLVESLKSHWSYSVLKAKLSIDHQIRRSGVPKSPANASAIVKSPMRKALIRPRKLLQTQPPQTQMQTQSQTFAQPPGVDLNSALHRPNSINISVPAISPEELKAQPVSIFSAESSRSSISPPSLSRTASTPTSYQPPSPPSSPTNHNGQNSPPLIPHPDTDILHKDLKSTANTSGNVTTNITGTAGGAGKSAQQQANRGFGSTIPSHQTGIFHSKRKCISCGSEQSPCWRPSWSPSEGQLCNSCGLRYKKTNARCLNKACGRIPAKGEWVSMKNAAVKSPTTGLVEYKCLYCNGAVETG